MYTFILEGTMLLIVGYMFYVKKYKNYSSIGLYMQMSKEKRKDINWIGFANFMFYAFLIAFICSLINLIFLQFHHNIKIYVRIWGILVTIPSLLSLYAIKKYDSTRRKAFNRFKN